MRVLAVLVLTVGALPLLFHLVAGPRRSTAARHAGGLGCCSASRSTRCWCSSAGATCAAPSATSATSPSSSEDAGEPGRAPRCRAWSRWCWSPSRRWRSAPGGCGSPAPPATSSSPRARVRPRLNASAIGGEYLSAASFLGVAGLVLTFGAEMLWYPVGWTAGYLVLLVLVAAPLRRSGAYTLPDFAEARLGSAGVRRLCSVLVVRSAGSTCCRSSRAPGSPSGRRSARPTWVGAGRGRASSCWSTWLAAGCAASPSSRRSSTG